jgi:iron complex outermembrane receptor protein
MKKTMQKLCCGFTLAVALFLLMPGIAGAEEPGDPSLMGGTQATPQTSPNQDKTADQTANRQGGNTTTADNAPSQTNVPAIEVEVQADKDKAPKEGSTEAGYKPDTTTTTGPWGKMKLQDTPYSINVMSSNLIENTIASSPDQLYRMNPLIQASMPQNRGYGPSLSMRGFSNVTGAFLMQDGMNLSNVYVMPLEDKERVEVLTGLSGFLFGQGHVGGAIDYILKRPTATPIDNITVGNYGDSQNFVHADLGGPLDSKGTFGYRLNLVTSEGNTGIDYNKTKRWLISTALDWHATDKLLAQFNYSHYYYYEQGTGGYWNTRFFNSTQNHPNADLIDPTKNYSQQWSFNRNVMDVFGTNLNYDINEISKIRVGYTHTSTESEKLYTNLYLTAANNLDYTIYPAYVAPQTYTNDSGYVYWDTKFKTATIEHKMTIGFAGDALEVQQHSVTGGGQLGGTYSMMFDPVYLNEPNFTIGQGYKSSWSSGKYWTIGDDMKLNEKWSAMVGLNYATIDTVNYNQNGTKNGPEYNKSKSTPSMSVLYKPTPWLTTYASYMEALVKGATAQNTPYNGLPVSNAGQFLEPSVSTQYEVGVKANIGQSLVSLAFFKIDQANSYYEYNNSDNNYTFTNDGRQINKGIELTTSGKITNNLTLVGGLTILDPKVTNTNTPSIYLDGVPYGISKRLYKLYAEYDTPFLKGLTLTAGAYYRSSYVANGSPPLETLPGYTTFDVGARYVYKDITYRLAVSNLTNNRYWSDTGTLGFPRTISCSITMKV